MAHIKDHSSEINLRIIPRPHMPSTGVAELYKTAFSYSGKWALGKEGTGNGVGST
jgi:hypothetical protein